ncbi:MAG TPA: LytTR family DNA-binding domain-containing protein, partial [Burkholderiaceae bacterium]
TDLFARYQPWRRIVEPGFWVALAFTEALFNSWTAWIEATRSGAEVAYWEPMVWEASSNVVILLLIPAILAFERRFSLQWNLLKRNLPMHVAGSIAFSLVHVGAMVLLRKLAYATQGMDYRFGNVPKELFYEYLKDVRGYISILAMALTYRFVMLRLQGEAKLLGEPDEGPPVEPVEQPVRFLVRKLGKEFLLPAAEIESAQAWGNYVNLRVRGHDYPLRSTMAAIEQRLDAKRFVRVHRSYIVNLDFVVEIEPLDSGDARAKLRDGSYVPVSRRYRDDLRKLSGGS